MTNVKINTGNLAAFIDQILSRRGNRIFEAYSRSNQSLIEFKSTSHVLDRVHLDKNIYRTNSKFVFHSEKSGAPLHIASRDAYHKYSGGPEIRSYLQGSDHIHIELKLLEDSNYQIAISTHSSSKFIQQELNNLSVILNEVKL